MNLRPIIRILLCSMALALASRSSHAAPPKLPATAIVDDTFFVATFDLSKLDAATFDATVKAALGDKAVDADEMLGQFKKYHEQLVTGGAVRLTVAFSGDPEKQEPQPVFYVNLKPGADHAALTKAIREDEGDDNPNAMDITDDGDCMILRTKGQEPPAKGSDDRTKFFADAMGDCDRAVVMVFGMSEPMAASVQRDVQRGAPAGLGTMAADSKWLRLDAALGEAAKADLTIQAADGDAAKRVADAITALANFTKVAIPPMKAAGPKYAEMADALTTFMDEVKPEPSGSTVTIAFDAKAAGAMVRAWIVGRQLQAADGPGNKAGL